jgi:hypothetical protein
MKNKPQPNRLIQMKRYVFAAINLYGVITLKDFVFVFNHYEKEPTTEEEAIPLLELLSNIEVTDFHFKDHILANGLFDLDESRDLKRAKELLLVQAKKPRYLPIQKEFLKYEDDEYVEPMKPLLDLEKFIISNQLVEIEEDDDIRYDVLELHDQIVCGHKTTANYMSYINRRGYQFEDEFMMKLFMGLVIRVHNHTRLYENCGYTPSELIEGIND